MLQRLMTWPPGRRLAWRAGRRLYKAARREERSNDIGENGEADVQRCVIRAVPAAMRLTVLDIGANAGQWTTRLLAQVPPLRRTAAGLSLDLFEPVPATADRLEAALRHLDPDGVARVHRIALSDREGPGRMALLSATGGTDSLHADETAGAAGLGFVDVARMTLARFCDDAGIGHVHLAKCDTEGHDCAVLRGAEPLLAAGRVDVFQFEYNHRWVFGRAFLKDVFDLVAPLPYRVARVEPGGIEVFETWHPELDRFFQSNYVLVREEALPWFETRHGRFDGANTYA